jgi:hypothetical protein
MRAVSHLFQAAVLWTAFVMTPAHAVDLTGLWTTSLEACDKVFVTKGKSISFSKNSELHGRGFIIEGRRIRSPGARCTITKSKESNDVVNMVASCATDIMYSDLQFSLKILGDGKVSRTFPEFGESGELAFIFHRCPSRPQVPAGVR